MTSSFADHSASDPIDSGKAWLRLALATLLGTLGGVGMWSVVVALPAIQADFGVDRASAALPYTLTMLGFAAGGVLTGRLADRFGIAIPLAAGTLAMGLGYIAAGHAQSIWQVALIHGGLIGLGCSATFGPLMADVSHWFARRRGIAVSIVAASNYIAGTFWPTVIEHFIAADGWRATHVGIGIALLVAMLPLTIALRAKAPPHQAAAAAAADRQATMPFSANTLQLILCIAGIGCCVAMSMPQVHIVAYCGDLGYGVARGAEMLSLMLACGIVSRLVSGLIADRIGGVRTLLLGSALQGAALFLYLWFNGLTSLYVISALFGLFQGGIVPSYAIIVREYFPPQQAGTRVGLVLMATLIGMALGGWMSGAIFDVTGSYRAAFLNGLGWNLLNLTIVAFLLVRSRVRPTLRTA
ncbi:MAG TPA: MFS transporter [Pseudolabrys sp.]|nr:MFS transporter [Pseudolabrys sp.]